MSGTVLRVAQVVGLLVLAGAVVGVVVGFVQWLLGVALVLAVVGGAWWLHRQVSGRRRTPAVGPAADRRTRLESRAVLDADGRCGWCRSSTLHKDDFGFPVTPLTYHRAEIEAAVAGRGPTRRPRRAP